MEQLNRLFGEYVKDMVPGIPNPSQVVKERILYRSAEEKSQLPFNHFKGDSMEVDKNDFTIPLSEQESITPKKKQIPKTETQGKDKYFKRKEKHQTGQIEKIEEIDKIKKIKSIRGLGKIDLSWGIESSRSKQEEKKAETHKAKDPAMDIEGKERKKQDKAFELKIKEGKDDMSMEDKDEKDNGAEEETGSDDLMMSLISLI